jgi:hypothetical protein
MIKKRSFKVTLLSIQFIQALSIQDALKENYPAAFVNIE